MGAKSLFLGAFGAGLRIAPAALGSALAAAHLDRRPRPRVRFGHPGYQILIYHRVLAAPDPFAMSPVPAELFDAQMRLLRRHFRVVSLTGLAEGLARGHVPPRTLCVTFDDGYRDNYEVALPILKRHGIPACIFVATDFIGTGRTTWYDGVLEGFRTTRRARLDIPEAGIRDEDAGGAADRHLCALRALEWLKGFPPPERDRRIAALLSSLEVPAAGESALMMDWDMVRGLRRNGIEIGAHTMSHPILSGVSRAEADREVAGSKAVIEAELQERVRYFAYPNGRAADYSAETKEAVRQAGFELAVTTNHGVNLPGQDPLELMRVQPWDASPSRFLGRLVLERILA